jgi:hypothetical protein
VAASRRNSTAHTTVCCWRNQLCSGTVYSVRGRILMQRRNSKAGQHPTTLNNEYTVLKSSMQSRCSRSPPACRTDVSAQCCLCSPLQRLHHAMADKDLVAIKSHSAGVHQHSWSTKLHAEQASSVMYTAPHNAHWQHACRTHCARSSVSTTSPHPLHVLKQTNSCVARIAPASSSLQSKGASHQQMPTLH